ncbi:MAG: transglutaminase-like domain-containing protein [Cyanobacteria bacterium]|nr:transglutaminase-like domain-containing protein [Cyanobacteriota bacterium]
MGASQARQRFHAEIQKPDPDIDLGAAALYIAQEEYPELDCGAYLSRLDLMAQELRGRLPAGRYPLQVIRTLNQYLFGELNFKGNFEAYYDPRNSFLNEVMDRRTGIPITLSLVYLELAKRLGFPMAGVGMPGHFLVRPTLDEMAIFVDAFHQGEMLFEEDCRDLIQQFYGQGARLQPEHLAPIGPKPFLMRMLTNLKAIYLHQQDALRVLGILDRMLLLFPEAVSEQRDRGLIHYRLGNLPPAQIDLQAYLMARPDAHDAFEIRQVLSQISRIDSP